MGVKGKMLTTADPEVEAAVHDLEQQALNKTNVVGDFSKNLEVASENPGERVGAMMVEKREEVVRTVKQNARQAAMVTEGNEDLHVDRSLAGKTTQGNAWVGAGRRSININPDAIVRAGRGKLGENSFRNLAAHENAHATKQKMMRNIRTAKKVVDAWDLHEWHSEKEGAKAEGKDAKSFNRDGQPDDYADAQARGNELQDLGVAVTELDEFIAKGDSEGLQQRVIELEVEKKLITPAEMQKNINEGRDTYTRALQEALLKEHPDAAETQVPNRV